MASSSLPLRLHPPLPPFCGFQTSSKLQLIPFQVRETSSHSKKKEKKIHILCCSNLQNSSSSSSSWEREEKRWEREEERWLREEQRWIREESRWNSERESLHQEIADLKFRIQTLLERRNSSTSDAVSNMATIFPVEMNQISESSDSGEVPLMLNSESEEVEEEEVKEMTQIEKEVRVSERGREEVEEEEVSEKKIIQKKRKKKTLKMGAEGEEVRLLQEALQKLGFYSGEEDIEYSCFSSGTESAVKTWQSSVGIPEDGIMTQELLGRLMVEENNDTTGLKKINEDHKGGDFVKVDGNNGASAAAGAAIDGSSHIHTEAPRDRVFLLGENRWEDPSRLTSGRNKQGLVTPTAGSTKCITCRGEGRLLCLECDGTGEPNIEEQFMDWVDEEAAKCPYCEGLGYSICDVCEGNSLPL